MLVIGLFVVGLLGGIAVGALTRRSWRGTFFVEAVGVVGWVALAVYTGLIYECPPTGECNPDLAWFYGLFALAGWLVGAAAPSVVAHFKRRPSGSGTSVA